jgi:hypothetical protein
MPCTGRDSSSTALAFKESGHARTGPPWPSNRQATDQNENELLLVRKQVLAVDPNVPRYSAGWEIPRKDQCEMSRNRAIAEPFAHE